MIEHDELEDQRGLEELLRFINGDRKDKSLADKQHNSKAAKRARQKQRKVCILVAWGRGKSFKGSRVGGEGAAKMFWHILPQKCASILWHSHTIMGSFMHLSGGCKYILHI